MSTKSKSPQDSSFQDPSFQSSSQQPTVPEGQNLPNAPETFAELVQRLEDLVKFTVECEKKELRDDISFIDVYKQLMLIKEGVELLNQDYVLNYDAMKAEGLVPEELKLTPEEGKILTKIGNLQHICEEAKERLHKSLQQNPEEVQRLTNELKEAQSTDKQKSRRRQSKFKGMGGKQGWRQA